VANWQLALQVEGLAANMGSKEEQEEPDKIDRNR